MSNDTDTELTEAKVRLKKDGTLVQRIDGTEQIIARYDKPSGRLEFETKEYSVKLYQQVTARIGTVANGTQQSGNAIRSIGVKGDAKPAANIPKRPRFGPLGDATPEVVEWYFEHNLPEAIIRYGVYIDSSGKPIRKSVRRVIEATVDRRDQTDDDLPWVKTGNKTQDKSPVAREHELVTEKNAIVARRSTHMTFTPQEVVGGFQVEDDVTSEYNGGDE
jgi:hypothetical protein